MIECDPSNVSSGFEMLMEELDAETDFVNNVRAKAFEKRDYDPKGRSGRRTNAPNRKRHD